MDDEQGYNRLIAQGDLEEVESFTPIESQTSGKSVILEFTKVILDDVALHEVIASVSTSTSATPIIIAYSVLRIVPLVLSYMSQRDRHNFLLRKQSEDHSFLLQKMRLENERKREEEFNSAISLQIAQQDRLDEEIKKLLERFK